MHTRRFLVLFAGLLVLTATSFASQDLVRVEGAPDVRLLQPDLSQALSVNSLRIGLELKNVDSAGSDAFVLSQYDPNSPNFHKWLSGEEYGRRFGAPDSDVQVLSNYLKANGFTNITVAPTKLFISADARISDNPHSVLGFSAWTSPIMIHSSTTTVAEPTEFLHTATLYFAISMLNAGYADGPYCYDALEIDGVVKASPAFRALPAGTFGYFNNVFSTTLPAGTHKITFICNNGNRLHEASYANNIYTRTITVH